MNPIQLCLEPALSRPFYPSESLGQKSQCLRCASPLHMRRGEQAKIVGNLDLCPGGLLRRQAALHLRNGVIRGLAGCEPRPAAEKGSGRQEMREALLGGQCHQLGGSIAELLSVITNLAKEAVHVQRERERIRLWEFPCLTESLLALPQGSVRVTLEKEYPSDKAADKHTGIGRGDPLTPLCNRIIEVESAVVVHQ